MQTKPFSQLSLRERCQFERAHNFNIADYRANVAHVKTSEGYDILFKGQRIGSTVKGFTRLGGMGWVNVYSGKGFISQGSTHKSLDDALRSSADQVMRNEVRHAYAAALAAPAVIRVNVGDTVTEVNSGRPIVVSRVDQFDCVFELIEKDHPAYRPNAERYIGSSYVEYRSVRLESLRLARAANENIAPTLDEALEMIKAMVTGQAQAAGVPVDEYVQLRPWFKKFIYTATVRI